MTDKAKTEFERTIVRNTKILGMATLAWVLSMAVASVGPEFVWQSKWLTLLAIVVNAGFGVGMMMANMKHLRALDELQQRIQLIAMGISLGVAVVFGLSLSMLETTGVLPIEADISHVVVMISLTYLATLTVATKRYG